MKTLKGFTLIELMIVVAIIGILAAVIMPRIFPNEDAVKHQQYSQVQTRQSKTDKATPNLDAESVYKLASDGAIFACVEGTLYLNAVSMNKGCDLTAEGISFKP